MTTPPTPESINGWKDITIGCGCETCTALLEAATACEALTEKCKWLVGASDLMRKKCEVWEAERDQALARVANYEAFLEADKAFGKLMAQKCDKAEAERDEALARERDVMELLCHAQEERDKALARVQEFERIAGKRKAEACLECIARAEKAEH